MESKPGIVEDSYKVASSLIQYITQGGAQVTLEPCSFGAISVVKEMVVEGVKEVMGLEEVAEVPM